ncbi:MAG: IS110 family transposase [Burkholderiales bacterium]
MQTLTTVGIDLAKNVFQVHGVDQVGRTVLRKRLRRAEVTAFMARLPSCVVGLEACCGAHYWARVLEGLGHQVKLIAPQFVKPYVMSNKNDANDAEAICEAVRRPHMRFVHRKSIEQQDVQALHRVRSRLIGSRTSLVNQIRGLLAEYGVVLPQSIGQVRRGLPTVLEDASNELSTLGRRLFNGLYEQLVDLDKRIEEFDEEIARLFRSNSVCQRIGEIEGVGPLIATAMISAIGDGRSFKNGRQLSAWLGLVPRQESSGGKTRLLGISKRGDSYLRTLLVHGARSVVYRAGSKADRRSHWIADKQRRLGTNRACVAVANKNARIIWAMLANEQRYLKST